MLSFMPREVADLASSNVELHGPWGFLLVGRPSRFVLPAYFDVLGGLFELPFFLTTTSWMSTCVAGHQKSL